MVEQAKLYIIIRNPLGEMCVLLTPPKPYGVEPDRPEIVYGGGEHAILYRTPEDAVVLDYIDGKMRVPLAGAEKALVIEYDVGTSRVAREYMAAISAVDRIPDISKKIITRGELREMLEKAAAGGVKK
ncbi:MAG: hypothetical protein LBI17_01025 [Rickettsiales bacterium]|nr:hypothetical protein [Rickettsiales bacterium]